MILNCLKQVELKWARYTRAFVRVPSTTRAVEWYHQFSFLFVFFWKDNEFMHHGSYSCWMRRKGERDHVRGLLLLLLLLLHPLLLAFKAAHALVVIPTPGGWTECGVVCKKESDPAALTKPNKEESASSGPFSVAKQKRSQILLGLVSVKYVVASIWNILCCQKKKTKLCPCSCLIQGHSTVGPDKCFSDHVSSESSIPMPTGRPCANINFTCETHAFFSIIIPT